MIKNIRWLQNVFFFYSYPAYPQTQVYAKCPLWIHMRFFGHQYQTFPQKPTKEKMRDATDQMSTMEGKNIGVSVGLIPWPEPQLWSLWPPALVRSSWCHQEESNEQSQQTWGTEQDIQMLLSNWLMSHQELQSNPVLPNKLDDCLGFWIHDYKDNNELEQWTWILVMVNQYGCN